MKFIMTPETQRFILEHSLDDVRQLALQSARFPQIDMALALRQITGRQKVKLKIPLFYNHPDILYPKQLSLEQSSSESTAKYKSSCCEGGSFADLTGGFGIDCYFISRNYAQASYVERNTELCEIARHNFDILGAENIRVFNRQSEDFLKEMSPVDLIYLDPARRNQAGNKVVLLSDCEPNVAELLPLLLTKAENVLIKLSPMLYITLALKDLPNTKEIHIISVDNECKEILFLIHGKVGQKIMIKTVNLLKNKANQIFNFEEQEEKRAQVDYTSELLQYLYEPNSSVMKSGAFNLVAERFGLKKLHKNTHLYTSNELMPDFPGRIFLIESVCGSTKHEIKNLRLNTPQANITVRNYPLTVNEFRKRTGIRDGGELYIFACKLVNDVNAIVQCKKIQ